MKAFIAIVPDPARSHLALRFDRAIDAIELAAESMHYVIDRYWLPWELEPNADWADHESSKSPKKDREQKEAQPGLLMFRWDARPEDAKASVLYVFLVGETSTAGLNGDQFAKAVKYVHVLNEDDVDAGKRHPGTSNRPSRRKAVGTYVLGPTSSASLGSLAEFTKPPNKFVIASTARSSHAIQAHFDKSHQFSSFSRSIADAIRELEAMLVSDHDIDHGQCKDRAGHQVAILSEASTTLGELDDDPRDDLCVDIFRYPREIASLRNALGSLSAASPAPGDKATGARPSLPVNLTDITNGSDEPPDFSKVQSALSQEATLMGFAAEMRRKHYRYIGINGSNPLDVVFLVSFLRSAVPNARLFSFDSDLLLQHEPDDVPYIGTLSVTTYPLLYRPLNRIGEVHRLGEHTRLPFTSLREEAIYNATVCLVRNMLNECSLGNLSERKDCSETSKKAPLWLTSFGVGGHWPIEVLGPAEALHEVPSPDLESLPLPSSWKAVCTLLCGLAVLHILVLLGLGRFSPKFKGFKLETVAPARQLFGIHTASATLALALALVGLSAWTPNQWTRVSELLAGILPLTCWLLTFKYFRWWWVDRTKEPEARYLGASLSPSGIALQIFFLIWVAAGVLALMWWALLHDSGGYYGAFFSFRALNLASIVSPLTPMLPLLAAIYIGAIFYVWHLVFDDKIRPRLNPSRKERPGEDKLRPGWRSEKFIVEAVNRDVQNAIYGGLILVLWIMIFLQPQFEPFERPQFQTLFEILFGLVILLILVSGLRLARIWQTLRKFLLEINRERTRRVLLRLKSEGSSWSSIWFYGSEDPDWDYMVRSLNVLQELWHTERPLGSEDVDLAVKNIRRERGNLQDEKHPAWHRICLAENDGKLENAISRAQYSLAATLNDVLDRLLVVWGNPRSTHEGIERQRLLEKFVALRWLAFIRAVIARIRLLIIFLATSFSLAMISLVIYSFEPHRELLWSVTALFIVIGLIIITVLIQMHTDPVLCRITGTKSGRPDVTFYFRLVALGTGPLVTLLATHFPSIGRYVVSLLQPGLEALK